MNAASHDPHGSARATSGGPITAARSVTVTRIGTQVVVRLAGEIGDRQAAALQAAMDEIATLALRRVVVDMDEVGSLQDAGVEFVHTLRQRWSVRLLNTPACLRGQLPQPSSPA